VFKITNQRGADRFYIPSPAAMMARIPMPGWRSAAMAIIYAQLISAATEQPRHRFKITTNGVLTSLYSFTGGKMMAQIPTRGWCWAATAVIMGRLRAAAAHERWHSVQNQH